MSQCPEYYKTAYKNEFYQFYADFCGRDARALTQDQAHALQSACEYIFRAGVKTPDPRDDYRKALDLVSRVYKLGNSGLSTGEEEEIVERVIGKVVRCKMQTALMPVQNRGKETP
jgi:hypothetical protein